MGCSGCGKRFRLCCLTGKGGGSIAAKKNVAVTPAFTGRNVSLSEISQASGIGIATLKKGLIAGAVDFGYAIPCGKGDQHRYYCPDRLVYLKTGYFNPNPKKQDTDSEAA